MKKIIIIISCICTLCAFGALTYFIFVHQSVTDYLEIAQTAIRTGDIKTAKKNFLEVIKRDKANEAAYKALAKIAEKEKQPALAARYWEIAARLNPLSNELHEKYINALLEAHRYYTITEQLKNKNDKSLSNIELYALTKANYFRNATTETKRLLAILLKRSPKDPKVILLHGQILFSSKNLSQAKKIFASLSNCPDKQIKTNALIGLGHTEIALKKIKKASIYYQKALKTSPDSMQVLMILANYNLSHGKQKLAKSQYQQMHKRFPENLITTIILAEIYTKKKNVVAITKLLNHIKTNNQTAVAAKYYLRALLAYVANDPKKLKYNLELCKVYSYRPLYTYLQFPEILISNDVHRIKKHVASLLEINNSLIARTDLCSQIERLAIENFKNNKFKTAAALAIIMQGILPKKSEIAHLAMVCAYYQKKWREAALAADKFNDICPNTLDYLNIKGRSLLYLNEAESALPLLKKLTALTPKKPEAWLWVAQAYQLLNKQKEVEACIEKMLQFANNSHSVIDPAVTFFIEQKNMKIADKIAQYLQSSQNKTFRAMALSIRAQSAQGNKKWQDAVKYLIKAYALEKNNDTLLYISDIYAENKKYDKALEYLTKVLKDTPDSPKALFRQALISQVLADYKQAIKIYRKLLVKYPQWSLVLVNLSDIMAIKGETQEALKLAQLAQKKSPLWPRGKLCLALRELDSKNYTTALRILELLLTQEPDNKIFKNAIQRCLVSIVKERIENKSFAIAKLRLKQLRSMTPDSAETAVLEKLLASKEKASKTSPKE
jgi:tetratricopeptide (TPR) repeat protein